MIILMGYAQKQEDSFEMTMIQLNPPDRVCPKCSKTHNTVLSNIQTGEIVTVFEECYDCLMKTAYTINPIERVNFDDTTKIASFLADAERKILMSLHH